MHETTKQWPYLCASSRPRRTLGGKGRIPAIRAAAGGVTRLQSAHVCVCCGAVMGTSNDHDGYFCPECVERSREQIGRDYEAAELGGEG
jgi:predicted RNA-binding Zn-ribbon protein involved in translation (DUF1610 family)